MASPWCSCRHTSVCIPPIAVTVVVFLLAAHIDYIILHLLWFHCNISLPFVAAGMKIRLNRRVEFGLFVYL
jgi:hypothetical protein